MESFMTFCYIIAHIFRPTSRIGRGFLHNVLNYSCITSLRLIWLSSSEDER